MKENYEVAVKTLLGYNHLTEYGYKWQCTVRKTDDYCVDLGYSPKYDVFDIVVTAMPYEDRAYTSHFSTSDLKRHTIDSLVDYLVDKYTQKYFNKETNTWM